MDHTREQALALLSEYTKSDSLLRHAFAVEAAMLWYARHFAMSAPEQLKWGIAGLLHDMDYELYPEPIAPNGHPFKAHTILGELGYPDDIREAIMGHALYSGIPRVTLMAKTLFAVDELTGLITASVYVRPDRSIHHLETPSVLKKFKDKAFAKGCNRDDIRLGVEELGIELSTHISNIIQALRERVALCFPPPTSENHPVG
jgi:predicted hydrolase (HD superfamily)